MMFALLLLHREPWILMKGSIYVPGMCYHILSYDSETQCKVLCVFKLPGNDSLCV